MADQPFRDRVAAILMASCEPDGVDDCEDCRADADAILTSEEMQQIRQLIAAAHEASQAAFFENDDAALERTDRALWAAFDALSGCVREWATTPEPKKEA